MADVTLGIEQVTSAGVVSAKDQQLSFVAPVGVRFNAATDLNSRTQLIATYEGVFKRNAALWHGPRLGLGLRIYGNNSYTQSTELNRVVVRYPFSVTLRSGILLQFHDLSPLVADENKVFTRDVQLFKPGMLYGTSFAVVLGFNSTDQLSAHAMLGATYARLPAVHSSARMLSVALALGVDYAL